MSENEYADREPISVADIKVITDILAEKGITVRADHKLDQDPSIFFDTKDGHFYDFGKGGIHYRDVHCLLEKRTDLIGAPAQARTIGKRTKPITQNTDRLTKQAQYFHKELEEFYELEESTLQGKLDDLLPSDWFKSGFPRCLGYRADEPKTLTVSALDGDIAQAVCFRRDKFKGKEVKWKTLGSKKFIPSKLTGKDDIYLASGMGELVMLEQLGVDYICIQSDGMAKHLTEPPNKIQHLIILPDNDPSFLKGVDTILTALNPKKASIVKWEFLDPREAAIKLETRDKFMEEVADNLVDLEVGKDDIEVEIAEVKMLPEPIDPHAFMDMMKQRMLDLNPDQHFSDKMMEAYRSFGAIYNEVSNFNRDGVTKRIIVPLSTGAGKTVSAKLYLAELAKLGISGMLVVSEVSVAIEAVKEINELAGADVAGVYYSVSEDNPDCDERCSLVDMPLIGIISHSMFTSRSHTGVDIDLLKYYDGKHRRCIIIDESINLVKSSSFGTEEIPDLMNILKRDKSLHNYTIQLSTVMNTMKKEDNAVVFYETHMKDMLEKIVVGTHEVLRLVDDRKVNISKRMRSKKDVRETELAEVISLLERIAFVFSEAFAITTEGKNKIMHRDIDLSGAFGSVVVLDATSTINPSYTFHQKNSDDIQFMERIDVRNYSNVNINVCHNKNLPQSKTAIYTTPEKSKTLNNVVKQYLAAIEGILEPDDQLLVCTYKILVPLFKHLCPFDNVKFIHWGSSDARGSNEFKDFNKAMAIGFFRRPQHVYNGAVLAIKDYKFYVPTNGSVAKDAVQLKNHLIVDDMVQFFNRVRCRVSIDEEGNCEQTELYLFTGGNESVKSLMQELIEQEMPNIQPSIWDVEADAVLVDSRKKNKLYRVAEEVIEWMLTVSYTYDVISQKNIQDYFGMRPGQIKRLKAEPHFQNLCEEEGIAEFKDGRSFMFHLPKNS